ncbi:MAG: outer membrane protein assembly factor BamD [Phycisphaerae bacterium]|nr:outer membrane protein assembly factor BamD [Phycisphaerae bacterium]
MIRILLPAMMGLCLLPMLPMASAQPTEGPEYVERWTFDPETGQWLEMARPEPGTEDGDLDLARQALAREDYTAAREQTEAWIETYGGAADRYPEALYVSATALLGLGDYRAAYDAYSALLNDFPGSVFAERAVAAQFRIGEQYLDGQRRKAWRGLLRVRDYDKGLEIMDDIVANHGGTDLAELALKTKADYYYRKGEFELAEDEYARLARDYPQSRYEPYALLQGAQSAMASFPGVNFDDAGLVEAEERFVQFRDRYPALAEAKQVPVILEQIRATRAQKEFVTAEYYIRTKQKRAAAYYFRSTIQHWPGTTWAAQAEARLVAMGLWEPAADEPTAATELPARVAMAGSE